MIGLPIERAQVEPAAASIHERRDSAPTTPVPRPRSRLVVEAVIECCREPVGIGRPILDLLERARHDERFEAGGMACGLSPASGGGSACACRRINLPALSASNGLRPASSQ